MLKNNYLMIPAITSNPHHLLNILACKQNQFKKISLLLIFSIISSFSTSIFAQQVEVVLTTGSSWVVPNDAGQITVECWGAGGGGGGTYDPQYTSGGAGGGGAYAKTVFSSFTAGQIVNYAIGAGGLGSSGTNPGGATWFYLNSAIGVSAAGGLGAANNSTIGATGGLASASFGTVKYSGGKGGDGSYSSGTFCGDELATGGGGAAAIPSANGANGGNASTSTGGFGCSGNHSTGGVGGSNLLFTGYTSKGGDGVRYANNGNIGTYGAGGSGAVSDNGNNYNGGNGGNGLIRITYTRKYHATYISMVEGSPAWCSGETRNVSVTIKNTGSLSWTDNGTDDFNIGVKWNAESNYNLQVDAGNLAPGATQTFNFTITAPSVSGNNNLIFNVVKNGADWFGGEYISSSITINTSPVMTGTMQVCSIGATSDLSITGVTDWVSYPSGGTITQIGNDRIHTFTSAGSFVTAQSIDNVSYLIVGGGGSGGSVNAGGNVGAGGGGAGGLIERNNISLPPSTYTVVIGTGGTGISPGANPGLSSSFNNENALGGGQGGHQNDATTSKGKNGASGGGGRNAEVGGVGNQGNNGGKSTTSLGTTNVGGGGGGGFNSTGGNTSSVAGGIGGTGFFSNISLLTYAKGGNGGAGGTANTVSTNSNANTGEGGAGATSGSTAKKGGNGGSGVVIIRYTVPKWTSSNPSVATVNELSGVVTSVSNGTTNITYSNTSGCSVTKPFNVNPTPTAVITSTSSTICHGNSATLSGTVSSGGTVTINNSVGAATTSGTTWSVSLSPTATTTYSISSVSGGGCTGTGTGSTTVTLPTKSNALSTSGESATCPVSGSNWVHFYHATSGNLIGSVNANGGDLGDVTLQVGTNAGGAMYACNTGNAPQYYTAYMGRNWHVNSTQYPSSATFFAPASIRLPYANVELTGMNSIASGTTTGNPLDNSATAAQVMLTKISGGSVDGNPTNDCSASILGISQSASGTIASSYTGLTIAGNYADFGVAQFSEMFLNKNINTSPLPVKLTNFSASCDKEVILNWTTASEQNSDRFIIEKSRDGQTWSLVASQTAAGTSNTIINYTQKDENSWNGVTYYSLRQIDYNGAEEIYGPISTSCEGNESSMTVYPNPNNGSFTIEIASTEMYNNAQLFLTDLTGKVITSQTVNVANGTTQILINDLDLKMGTYLVTLRGADQQLKPVKVMVTK